MLWNFTPGVLFFRLIIFKQKEAIRKFFLLIAFKMTHAVKHLSFHTLLSPPSDTMENIHIK